MKWNWQQPDWPNFRWGAARFQVAEQRFLLGAGVAAGMAKHLPEGQRSQLSVALLSTEAVTTSKIEGEILDRASVQSSIQRQLGLAAEKRRVRPAEQGIAEMMVDLYRSSASPLTESDLFRWHSLLMKGRRDLELGQYRSSSEPMQIVSGAVHAHKVHFEAPPSLRVPAEMKKFLSWFERTSPGRKGSLPALARAGVAHLYFESIHPFEDGNGRVGRAIAEKALAQTLGHSLITGLAPIMLAHRKDYYQALERASKSNDVTDWLAWFGGIALEAQSNTTASIEFLIEKTKFFDRLTGQLNERQNKALSRMLRAGVSGFEGGLTAGNYSTITGASPATATRDLADLVEKGALLRRGERKYARYDLAIPIRLVPTVRIDEQGQVSES